MEDQELVKQIYDLIEEINKLFRLVGERGLELVISCGSLGGSYGERKVNYFYMDKGYKKVFKVEN